MGDKLEYKISYGKSDFKDAKLIRQLVFVQEQGFKNEFDEIDEIAYHLVIYRDKKAIATGRMFIENNSAILGRIAVIKEFRHQGFGKKVIECLENKVQDMGYQLIYLSAQLQAQSFYEKQGYIIQGNSYYDEWCLHIRMKKEFVYEK